MGNLAANDKWFLYSAQSQPRVRGTPARRGEDDLCHHARLGAHLAVKRVAYAVRRDFERREGARLAHIAHAHSNYMRGGEGGRAADVGIARRARCACLLAEQRVERVVHVLPVREESV